MFCDSYSPDGESQVSVDASQNLVFAGAGSGAGFRLAPGIAREALELIVAHWPDAPATAKPTLSTVSMD